MRAAGFFSDDGPTQAELGWGTRRTRVSALHGSISSPKTDRAGSSSCFRRSMGVAMARASGPARRTTPMPPRPGGVAMATMVSSRFISKQWSVGGGQWPVQYCSEVTGLPGALCVIYTYGLPLASRYSHLFSNRFSTRFSKGAGIFDAETYISTQPAQALEEARVPDPHEDEERGRSAVAPPGQGAQARLGETGFPRVVFPPFNQLPVASRNRAASRQRLAGNWVQQDGELVSGDASEQRVKQRAAKAGFPRAARLLKHADFERVYKQGRRQFSSHMTVFYLRQAEGAAPEAALP